MKRIIITFSLGLLLLACMRIEENADSIQETELTITAYRESEDITKTVRQTDGSVFWSPGDAVSLFFIQGENGGSRFVAQNTTASALAEFKGTITGFAGSGETAGGEFWFWGVYPYSEENSCDGTSITTVLPAVQTAKAGTFDDGLFITMAREKGLELRFFNLCGGFKFTVSREDVKTVKFHGNADENIAGKVKANWDAEGHPEIKEYVEGKKEITLNAPKGGTFVPGVEYYIIFFPELLSEGFTMTFLTSGGKQGDFMYSSSRQFRRGIFIGANNVDTKVTTWTDAEAPTEEPSGGTEGGTESGLYLGISSFDHELVYYPAHLISEESLEDYYAIVDAMQLTTKSNTLLYYSVDEDITSMKNVRLPSNLFNVSLVTFTDGLDQGSLSKRRGKYNTDLEYLDDIHARLENELVSGLPINSYAVGLNSNNANSNPTLFDKNLNLIASTPRNSSEKYVYKASNMTEVNSSFESIASQISQSFKLQKLTIYIPFPSGEGAKIRFCLDGKTATNSSKYIEGVFDMSTYSLTNVKYVGLTSSSGDVVPYSVDTGEGFIYVFEDIPVSGTEITLDKIRHWHMRATETTWTENDEFDPDEGNKIETVLKSAFIMLNIDLSRSIGDKFTLLQNAVKNFISKLYSNAVDPNVVKAAKLNKTELALTVGKSETLQATVSPSTASASGLRWSSAIPSVATVDGNGKVTALSEGTTIISVSSEEGKELATCTVRVQFQHVSAVSLNKSSLSLYVGKTETLSATVTPSDASEPAVTWSSSNPAVATVNNSGVVTALALGTSTIEVKTADGAKTASCTVTVGKYAPSEEPKDLSLAVYSYATRAYGYVSYDEYADVNWDELRVEGLTVLSNSGNFIIALEDATSGYMYYDAASLFYRLPNQSQGVSISARWTEINAALIKWGGDQINGSYWTSATAGSNSGYYTIQGAGGQLVSIGSGSNCRVREVVPLSELTSSYRSFITKSKGLYLTYLDGSTRHYVDVIGGIPAGYSVEGLFVQSYKSTGNVIIEMRDAASSSYMTWSAASEVYGSQNLPSKQQGQLISARLTEINAALSKLGSDQINGNYWTSAEESSGRHYTISGGGGKLSSNADFGTCHVRLIIL